jgi:hypothetical protein
VPDTISRSATGRRLRGLGIIELPC